MATASSMNLERSRLSTHIVTKLFCQKTKLCLNILKLWNQILIIKE
jgi:hypothetical protein